MLYYLLRTILWPVLMLIFRPVVYGKENMRIKGKAIFVSNHRSLLDPIMIALVSPRIVHFMAKMELFKHPITNLILRAFFAFPVNRKTADRASLKNAMKVLEEGKVFGIFAEGKRSVTEDLDEFEKGAAFLAIRAGAPVVPIYISAEGYRKFQPKLMVGKPINVTDIVASTSKSALVDVVTDEIADSINALKTEMEAIHCR